MGVSAFRRMPTGAGELVYRSLNAGSTPRLRRSVVEGAVGGRRRSISRGRGSSWDLGIGGDSLVVGLGACWAGGLAGWRVGQAGIMVVAWFCCCSPEQEVAFL